MAINKILYIDDSFENGMAATLADARIEFVSSPELIERPLIGYDCIITDMQMKHAESGFEVVERALKEGRLPYIATGGTYDHGGTFNRVRVFDSGEIMTFDKMSKSEERFWREALAYIDQHKNPTREALRKVRETLGIGPENQIKMLMDYYRINYRDKTFNLTELKGGERK
jgi:CheY-like chemotaxis protein